MKQLISCQWKGESGTLTYTILGLAEDGSVWRMARDGWIKQPMTITTQSKPRGYNSQNNVGDDVF